MQSLVDELPSRPTLVLAAQGEHIRPIERNIRFVKEKVRTLRCMLPFERIPKFVVVYMVFNATIVMNMFPRKGGSQHYSPQAIMNGRGVTVEDLRIPFGEYVQVTNATLLHNSLEPRTRGAIALGMMGNDSGGRVLLALDSGKLIRQAHAKVIPMTVEVITRVNHLGRDESTLFTFTNRRGEEVGERTLNRIEGSNDEIEHDMHNVGVARDGINPNLDVVDDVAGVDSPYEPYVDDWNDDVPTNGDDAIDQDVAGATDYNIIDTDKAVFEAGEMEFEPVLGNLDLTTLPPQPKAPREVTTPPQNAAGRPTRDRKPVSRLIPSFKGKTYGTTMVLVSADMMGMSTEESILYMENEMQVMGFDNVDSTVMGMIFAANGNMSVKQSTAKLGYEATM